MLGCGALRTWLATATPSKRVPHASCNGLVKLASHRRTIVRRSDNKSPLGASRRPMSRIKTLAPAASCSLAVLALALGLTSADEAQGRKVLMEVNLDQMMMPMPHGEFGFGFGVAQFRFDDMPLGPTHAPTVAPHVGSHGGTVVVDADGVLVLDRDGGKLL